MEALRLIKTGRHALAQARSVGDVLTEAWQTGMLTELIGARIAEAEEGELGALGQLLCEAGAHAVSSVDQPTMAVADDAEPEPDWHRADWSGQGRAGRMTELGELAPVLAELERLLHEVADSLVVLACGAEGEGLYWRCIDGVDAGSECKDLVAELMRAVRRGQPDETAAAALYGRSELGLDELDLDDLVDLDSIEDLSRSRGLDDLGGQEAETTDVGKTRTGARAADPEPDSDSELAPDLEQDADSTPEAEVASSSASASESGSDSLVDDDEATVVAAGRGPGPGRSRPGPVVERGAEGGVPILLVTLSPPVKGRGYQPEVAGPAELSACPRPSTALVPEDCRSASSPARSALTELSRSCICSSRLLGAAVGAGRTPGVSRGTAGVSDQGSDMRGPLQLGSAV
ncbi:hypothetical protein CFP65_2416 [Kitasatospora sp. MMS16-BH015]|uniref:DUF6099 family protein n=1 Tax=Kitasatospora sp. MMS16-BH015 TaxID=2018025 RepID=UPI000CA1AE60|nr:hypothetical protein CFP65_2416 [Kitasatospora sp. MMS16-BH015]